MTDAAREAGEIARRFWEGENQVWDKGQNDPVSEADLAVDAFLKDRLLAARPGYGWLSEETEDDRSRLSARHVFIVDPIDGTRAFVEGGRTWAHSLAIAEHGRITAGVVFLPILDKLYGAEPGGGAALNDTPIRVSARKGLSGATLLASRPALEARHWQGGVPDINRHFRPSLAYRMCLVAEGRFDAMLTIRDSWEWDIAAGSLISAEAGAAVSDRFGDALIFNREQPKSSGVVAGGQAVQKGLVSQLG